MPPPQQPYRTSPSSTASSAQAAAQAAARGRRLPPQLWTTKSMILLSTCVASSAYLFGLFQGFEKGKAKGISDMTASAASGDGAGAAAANEADKMKNDPSVGIYGGR